jgi:class 3 adenylate cyclase
MRECVSAEEAAATVRAQIGLDVTDLLPLITCETLLIAYTGEADPPPEAITRLTWQIVNSRFVVVEGTSLHSSEALEETRDFLGAGYEPRPVSSDATAFHAILFTDLVGHTQMMSRLGDSRGREMLREHERITRDLLSRFRGSEVKTMGDGFMASFGSVTKAVECAIGLQQAFAEWSQGSDEVLTVRVGLDAGEPIEEEGDLFGATVIMAARIAAKAEAHEILVSEVIRGLCSGKGFPFADRGHFVPKGFEEAVRLFEIAWQNYP